MTFDQGELQRRLNPRPPFVKTTPSAGKMFRTLATFRGSLGINAIPTNHLCSLKHNVEVDRERDARRPFVGEKRLKQAYFNP